MKRRVIAVAVSFLVSSAWADMPSFEQAAKGAAGGALGGLLGSQVGQGRGTAAATAVGAGAGAVVASGCKPTWLSAVGGALGGLLGAQVGSGNGKNVMAGVGSAVGAVAGSDCAEEDKVPSGESPVVRAYTPNVGRMASMNGISLTEVSPSAFPMGRFEGFPRITRKADFATLDAMSRGYAKASMEAAANQDWEAFALNRRLGMRITEYRMHHQRTASAFVSSLTNSTTGTGVLAPGATVFLPAFARWGSAQKLVSAQYEQQLLSSNVSSRFDWKTAPKVADLGNLLSVLKTATGALSGNGNNGGIGSVAAQKKAGDMLGQLPVGAVFSAHDENGNSFLVERTPEGFNIGNPSGRPVAVQLGKLGFIPDMPVPNADRRNASPLVMQMQTTRHELFWEAINNGYGAVFASTAAPNKVVISALPGRYFDANGRLASDPQSIKSGELAYKTNPSYRIALDLANHAAHRDMRFEGACFKTPESAAYDTNYLGENAEVLSHECLSKDRRVLRSQNYYVVDGKTMQTFESLVKDKATAKALAESDNYVSLAESVISFVPAVGNLDSAAKCVTGTSITVGATGFLTKSFNMNDTEAYRAFVSDLLPPPEDVSGLEAGMTCAAAVPILGTAGKALSKVGNWTGAYRDWAASEKAQQAFKSLNFFDTNVFAKQDVARFGDVGSVSQRSIQTLKGFYDSMQMINGGNQLAKSAIATQG